jgi:hypothetical protein
MGTKLTFQGIDATVELDDQAITLRGAAATSAPAGGEDPPRAASGGEDPVVIPRWEVEDVTVKSASLLGYGKLVITTKAGREHTVEFPRDAEERFTNLAAIVG